MVVQTLIPIDTVGAAYHVAAAGYFEAKSFVEPMIN